MAGSEIIGIGVILLVGSILGVLFQRLKQSQVLGYITAGIILGPLLLSYVNPIQGLAKTFGDLGLFVILFYLGLELSLKGFVSTGIRAFLLALIDLACLGLAGFILMQLFGFSTFFSVIVGLMMFATSTAIVAKFSFDNKLTKHPGARLALSILILQDFIAVSLLILVTSIGTSQGALNNGLISVAFVVASFTVIRKISKYVEKWLESNGFGHTETTIYAISIGIIFSEIASLINVSPSLGAYFAGFALSETMAGNRIKKDLDFLREFFLLFFFVVFGSTLFYNSSVGKLMLPSAHIIISLVGIAAIITVLMILIHFGVFSYFGKKFGLNSENSSTAAIMLTPLGEFAIIIAAASQQVLGPSEAQLIGPLAFLMVIISLLTFKPLYSMKQHHKRFSEFLRGTQVKEPANQEHLITHTKDNHDLLKSVFLNFLIILSLLAIAINFYYVTPKEILGFPNSTELSYITLFVIFSSYSFMKLYRSFKTIVKRASLKQKGELLKPF